MANNAKKSSKPRIRKTAPTVRQRAEAAQAEASKPKTRRVIAIAKKAGRPLHRLHLPNNRVFRALSKISRIMLGVLNWLVPRYFVNSWREVRQVVWPTRKETWRLTLAVFIFAIIFGAMVAGVDKVLDLIFKKVVLK